MRIQRFSIILSVSLLFTGCSPMESTRLLTSQNSPQNIDLGDLEPGGGKNPVETPAGSEPWKGLTICSELDFKGLTWSKNVEIDERDPFALALNISGSFEGRTGWSNLTNNFDGQGISMGLLNQNLGQGSLQPMWIEMHADNLPVLQSIFSRTNLNSLVNMLAKWDRTVTTAMVDVEDYGYSGLDDPNLVAADLGLDPLELQTVQSALVARNQVSVDWAKATLYNGSSFKADWSKSLKDMANSAPYRSIQVRKAEKLHEAALALMTTLKFKQMNAYLFFFDIKVQNGGLSTSVINEYKAWLAKNPGRSEETRLKKILEIRLRTVIPKYVADVKARKTALITGAGTVHGENRRFEKEFCADIDSKLQL